MIFLLYSKWIECIHEDDIRVEVKLDEGRIATMAAKKKAKKKKK